MFSCFFTGGNKLCSKQLKKLLSAFHPLSAPSSQALANASRPHAMLPLAMENQYRLSGRPPATEIPLFPGMYHRLVPAFSEPQHISDINPLQHGFRSLPATSSYVTHVTQDSHYSRFFLYICPNLFWVCTVCLNC